MSCVLHGELVQAKIMDSFIFTVDKEKTGEILEQTSPNKMRDEAQLNYQLLIQTNKNNRQQEYERANGSEVSNHEDPGKTLQTRAGNAKRFFLKAKKHQILLNIFLPYGH